MPDNNINKNNKNYFADVDNFFEELKQFNVNDKRNCMSTTSASDCKKPRNNRYNNISDTSINYSDKIDENLDIQMLVENFIETGKVLDSL